MLTLATALPTKFWPMILISPAVAMDPDVLTPTEFDPELEYPVMVIVPAEVLPEA